MYVNVLLKQLSLLCLVAKFHCSPAPRIRFPAAPSGLAFGVVISDLRLQN